jgi:hypothetical protein
MRTRELLGWALDEHTNAVRLTAPSGAIGFVVYFLTDDIVYAAPLAVVMGARASAW